MRGRGVPNWLSNDLDHVWCNGLSWCDYFGSPMRSSFCLLGGDVQR
jgi:hypothetical protein